MREQATEFLKSNKAQIMACGTCLKYRKQEATNACPMNTVEDLYALVQACDKILTF